MQGLSYITTHETDGAARMLASLRGGTAEEFFRVFLRRHQGLEDVLWSLIESRQLANATGATLEMIGEKVGQPRPAFGPASTADGPYRVLIYGKIAENVSYGTIPDIYNILRSLELVNVKVYQNYPASITINYVSNSLTLACACVGSIIARATHPITAIDITEHFVDGFGFEGNILAGGFDFGPLGAGV
jgi:hypothetical protein